MSRPLSLAFVCVLLLGTAVAHGGIAGAHTVGPPSAQQEPTPPSPVVQSEQFASTTVTIEVYRNGSARWTFSYFTTSLNETEQEDFRTYADRFESEETDLYRNFQQRARSLTAAGTNATGREMNATGFERRAGLEGIGNRGVVEMSYLWTNFAQVQDGGDSVVVADVFEGVFYIGPDQWLVFEAGPGLQFDPDRIEPEPDDFSGLSVAESETITYFGEQQFPDNNPRVTFTPAEDGGETTTSATTTEGAGTNTSGFGSLSMMAFGAIVVIVGLGVVAAWRSGMFDPEGGSVVTEEPDDGGGGGGGGVAATEADGEADNPAAPVPEEELLTDEDRVIKLLEDNGGRMKQANIVEETGWSKSKVSMLLSDMEDDGEISKLRVGRENIISLAGHEPDAAGSPFDDDS